MANTSLPADLVHIAPFLQRAKEMDKADPVIAYWCTFHAMQVAMTGGTPATPESRQVLFEVMDKLEAMRKTLAGNDAVSNDEAAAAYVENFALKIFSSADNEDRAGKAKKTTAMRFLAASTFLSVLYSVCPPTAPPDPAIANKIKYAKWKATEISKALKAGRIPTPGPAGSELNEDGTDAMGLASLDAPEVETVPKEARETMEEAAAGADDIVMVANDPPLPSADSRSPTPVLLDVPSKPPAPAFSPPTASHVAIVPSSPVAPPSPPAFAPSLQTPAPSAAPATAFATLTRTVPAQLYEPPTSSDSALDPTVIAAVQKHAKWAISALNFEDVETARKELRLALQKLG